MLRRTALHRALVVSIIVSILFISGTVSAQTSTWARLESAPGHTPYTEVTATTTSTRVAEESTNQPATSEQSASTTATVEANNSAEPKTGLVTEAAQPASPAQATVAQVAATATETSGRVVDLKNYKVVMRTIVKNLGSNTAKDVMLRIPIVAKSTSHYQAIAKEQFSPQPDRIETDSRGNRIAVFNLRQVAGNGQVAITETYWLRYGGYVAGGLATNASVASNANSPASLVSNTQAAATVGTENATTRTARTIFLGSEEKIQAADPQLKAKAQELTRGLDTASEKAQAIFDYVIGHVDYNGSSPYRNQGALAAFNHGEGVCEEYASLFVAMTRAVDVPARIVNGFARDDKKGNRLLPGDNGQLVLKGLRHQWAEFYSTDEGWVPVDPTFSGKKQGDYYRFGYLPTANHIVQNYGDQAITGRYTGGKLTISTEQVLSTN